MQGELDLNDGWHTRPKRPKRPERAFVAIMPDKTTSGVVDTCRTQIINAFQLTDSSLIRASRFHISIRLLGDFKRLPSPLLYAAKRAGDAVSMPPFEMTFRSFKSFESGKPNEKPLVLLGEGDGVTQLYTILGACLNRYGLSGKLGLFTPHLTLLYSSKIISEQRIEPIRLVVKDFVLIHSKLWLSQYEILQRWRLH